MSSRALAFLLFFALVAEPVDARPAFRLLPLGVLGGIHASNLTAFGLRAPDDDRVSLLLDAGSVEALGGPDPAPSGVATHTARMLRAISALDGVLLSHAHLDHVAGLVIASPLAIDRARLTGRSLPLFASAETLDALARHVLAPPIWGDFTHFPKPVPALALVPLEADVETRIGPFRVRRFPLAHPVASSGFRIESPDGAIFYFLGDTGLSPELARRAGADLRSGRLRGVAIECSSPAREVEFARNTGHLTTDGLLLMAASIAQGEPTLARPLPLSPTIRYDLCSRLRKPLVGVRILVIHRKPTDVDVLDAELATLARSGLPLVVPERGADLDL